MGLGLEGFPEGVDCQWALNHWYKVGVWDGRHSQGRGGSVSEVKERLRRLGAGAGHKDAKWAGLPY